MNVVTARRCHLCGDTGYAASFGGPNVCPPCDAGDAWFVAHPIAQKRLMGLASPATTNERHPDDIDVLIARSSLGTWDAFEYVLLQHRCGTVH